MKIEDMRAFVAVVRHKSVSRAAEAMQISQSVVTRRLQSLEEELGVELLNRNTRPPIPTEVGLGVFDQALSIIQQIDRLAAIVPAQTEAAMQLKIGMPQFLGEALSYHAVRFLKEMHPSLAIQLTTALSPTLMDSIDLGELDAALVVLPRGAELPAHLTGDRVGDFELGIISRNEASYTNRISLRDIHMRGWVLNPPGCGFRLKLQEVLEEQGLPLKLNLDVFGTELQFSLVASGLGLGLVPKFMLEASRHAQQLMLLNVSDFEAQNTVWLVYGRASGRLASVLSDLKLMFQDYFRS